MCLQKRQSRLFQISSSKCIALSTGLAMCPGFVWDSVNFHAPVKHTAGRLTQNWPNKRGIPYPVLSCTVLSRGSWPGGRQLQLGRAWGIGRWELLCAFRCLICIFLSVLVLLLFASFTVLLNCPYPNPPVFCLSSFHSPPHPSGGRGDRATTWPFGAGHSQTMTPGQSFPHTGPYGAVF